MNSLVAEQISILYQSVELLTEIGKLPRAETVYPKFGAHLRHCLDFVERFLVGLENGEIDYNKRERNTAIETNRAAAIDKINELTAKLQEIEPLNATQKVLVRHERASNIEDENSWCASSVAREVEFLQSHTIHHYALIKLLLKIEGVEVSPDFGVAFSTLKFWQTSA